MTLQFSDTVRDAINEAYETAIGTAAVLKFRTGAPPATCGTADSGTALVSMTLPSDWMAASSGGVKAKTGTWSGTAAASGRPSHFREYATGGTVCHSQGIACGPWTPSTTYAVGDHITNDSGKVYKATTGGTSAASGGPTGTGTGITDGTGTVWAYVQAAADLALDGNYITSGQTVTQSTFSLTAPGA